MSSDILGMNTFHRHFHVMDYLKNERFELFVAHLLNGLGASLVSIFIPIYLLVLGFSVSDVCVFYGIRFLTLGLFFLVVIQLGKWIGLKHVMLVRVPLAMLYFYLLSSFDGSYYYGLIALIGGIEGACYWLPIHGLFARYSGKEVGKSSGILIAIPKIASIIAPLVGGFVAAFLGFNLLFYVAMFIIALSVVPLFLTAEVKLTPKLSIKKAFHFYKTHRRISMGNFVHYGGLVIETIIWPIFVYMAVQNTVSIGLIGVVSAIANVFLMFSVGKRSDRDHSWFLAKVGALGFFVVWILRSFIGFGIWNYVWTLLAGFCTVLIGVPLLAKVVSLSSEYGGEEIAIYKEVILVLARSMMLFLAAVVFAHFEDLFVFTGFTYLVLLLF